MNVRNEVQSNAVKAIQENNGHGLIAVATGVGKSKIAIDYVKSSFSPNAKGILITPTISLKNITWKKQAEEWGFINYYNNMKKVCTKSIHKISDENFDYVIFDEAHSITEKNVVFFKNNRIKSLVCLTATPPKFGIKAKLLEEIGISTIFNFNLSNAVHKKIVNNFTIEYVKFKLNNTYKTIKAKNFYTTEQRHYDYLTKIIANIEKEPVPNYKLLKIMRLKRMRFIYSLKAKPTWVKKQLENLKDKRVLVFTGTIDNANYISNYVYHSKSSDKYLKMFTNNEINHLVVVNSLDEGFDIQNVDIAIISQIQSSELKLIQRIGRVIRFTGNTSKIFICYYKDTVDEEWVKKASNIKNN